MTCICVSKSTTIGSDNSLSPDRHQAIIWTNIGILLIGPLGTNFSEILIEIYTWLRNLYIFIQENAFENVVWKMVAILSQLQYVNTWSLWEDELSNNEETKRLWTSWPVLIILRPRQYGCHFADDTFKCTFLNEKFWILNKTSLKYVPASPINNIPALVHIMTCCLPGDKPLSEPMMITLPTLICVTRPQWVSRDKMVAN